MYGRENDRYFAAKGIPIQMIAENLIGFETIPQTIPHYCFESFRRHNKRDALAYKVEGVWHYLNGEAVIERVKRILGVGERMRINLQGTLEPRAHLAR